jgi:outer membrane protein
MGVNERQHKNFFKANYFTNFGSMADRENYIDLLNNIRRNALFIKNYYGGRMRKIIMSVCLVLFLSFLLYGESFKIAYIDTDRVMKECQDTQEAQQLFQTEQQSWNEEIQGKDTEIQRLKDDFEQKKLILSESGKTEAQNKIKELSDQREQRVSEVFGENGLAMQKNAELLEPILNKLRGVIEKISTDDNIDMVFDAATGGILYAVPRLDITDQVIEEMNKVTDTETKQ